MDINVVVLAAGKGSRMKSSLPKVLQPLANKPLLRHVLDTALRLDASRLVVVVGHGSELVKSCIGPHYDDDQLIWVEQNQQLGTGHAVAQALPELDEQGVCLILYGDVPLVRPDTLRILLDVAAAGDLGLLTVNLDNPTGYGRIVRDDAGAVTSIIEQKDASKDQLQIREVNTGIVAVRTEWLQRWIPALSNQNAQGEYYLTDIIAMAAEEKKRIVTCPARDPLDVEGVNDKVQLAQLERAFQQRLAEQLMREGVTLADPQRIDIRGSLKAGTDCYIDVNCVFEGEVVLGDGVHIGPNCHITQATIGDQTRVKSHSVLEQASLEAHCDVGPFARLRPGTRLADKAKVGNFVETKNAQVGPGSKINHLSYVGDSILGADVNVGAGTITCNYDGVNKHQTLIGDNAFIGSNSSLVAPIDIGANATIGAGSTVTRQAPPDALTVTRAKQVTLTNWKRPTKAAKSGSDTNTTRES